MEVSLPSNQPQELQQSRFEFWQKNIKAWRASGLSQKKFCQQSKLNYAQFIYWRAQSEKQSKSTNSKKLLPVKVASHSQPPSASAVRLRLPNGVMVEVPCVLSADKLKQLFHCLGVTQ